MDKSSFSSWLHTAAGGLTCHGRIQPLIHLCFPRVFLNFTHGAGAITESEPAFPCQPTKTRAWPVQPEASPLIWEPRSRQFVFSLFDCDREKKGNLSFSKRRHICSPSSFALSHFQRLLRLLLSQPPLLSCQLCHALPSNIS